MAGLSLRNKRMRMRSAAKDGIRHDVKDGCCGQGDQPLQSGDSTARDARRPHRVHAKGWLGTRQHFDSSIKIHVPRGIDAELWKLEAEASVDQGGMSKLSSSGRRGRWCSGKGEQVVDISCVRSRSPNLAGSSSRGARYCQKAHSIVVRSIE